MVGTRSIWEQLSEEISAAIARVAQSVVAVHGRHRVNSSGLAWDEHTVVTAAHALARDQDIQLTLPDGSTASAKLLGRDAGTDIAVLQTEATLQPATRAPTGSLAAGQWTVAVARLPSGRTVASGGIISEVGPAWRTWRGGLIDQNVRLDGTVAPWFGGAPLLGPSAEPVGLCTTGLTRGRAVLIPLHTVERVGRQLKEQGQVWRAYVGLAMQQVELSRPVAQKLAIPAGLGALVVSVQPDAPAEQAGVLVGDVLVQLGGKAIRDAGDVQGVLADASPGETLQAVLVRGGERQEVSLSTVQRPAARRPC